MKPEDYWPKVNLCDFLKLMLGCLEQIHYLLSLNVYGWTRDSSHPDIWSLMSVDGTVVDFYMQNGKPHSIINVTLVKSPKYGVSNEIKAFVRLFNEVARKCEGVELIEILEKDDTKLQQET